LIEEAGGKVISYYMTTGDSDFLLISEANESEAIIAPLMAFSAAGMISNVATVRAWNVNIGSREIDETGEILKELATQIRRRGPLGTTTSASQRSNNSG